MKNNRIEFTMCSEVRIHPVNKPQIRCSDAHRMCVTDSKSEAIDFNLCFLHVEVIKVVTRVQRWSSSTCMRICRSTFSQSHQIRHTEPPLVEDRQRCAHL